MLMQINIILKVRYYANIQVTFPYFLLGGPLQNVVLGPYFVKLWCRGGGESQMFFLSIYLFLQYYTVYLKPSKMVKLVMASAHICRE